MKAKLVFLFFIIVFLNKGQTPYPLFGPEIPVTINGYTIDAMEPFISLDGNAMFFNSINNATNTSLFYAGRINDSLFNIMGFMPVVNEATTPYLNAVASVDSANNFFWVSLRNYPTQMDNLHKVTFTTSSYTNFARVHGDFNIQQSGWLIMDAAINYDGNYLCYCNAYLVGCGGLPCKGSLGLAQKVNDSTFNKLSNTTFLFSNVNDTNYVVYAPQITKDGLELYYTRYHKASVLNTEICVSVRTATTLAFSLPQVIYSNIGLVPEAPTISTDKSKLYYHRKENGVYKLFLRYRSGITQLVTNPNETYGFYLYPNPVNSNLEVVSTQEMEELFIYSGNGKLILKQDVRGKNSSINVEELKPGFYFIKAISLKGVITSKFVKD